jgi:hypothetical protein
MPELQVTKALLRSAIPALVFGAVSAPIALSATEIPFGEARLYFELNNTDGDLGIHASIDGGPWKTLTIEDPRERTILGVSSFGRLRRQGMTQLFFESAEPPFEQLPPDVFFARFPEGAYEIGANTLDGQEMEATVMISHRLPGPPENLRINGILAADACDEPNVPIVTPPVVITWDAVTMSHKELGITNVPVTVDRYQVFAEQRVPGALKYSLDLRPKSAGNQYTVAPELLALGDSQYKFEIQVREANGNQTAVENCFKVRR